MPLQNLVSFSVSTQELEQIRAAVGTLENVLLPKLILLGAETRHQLPKMGNKTVGFVTKALEYAQLNPNLQPKSLDLAEAQKDLVAVSSLFEFSGTLARISEMVNDTMTQSCSEAYGAALSFYSAVKGAAKDHQPGAQLVADDLKTHFPRALASKPLVSTDSM